MKLGVRYIRLFFVLAFLAAASVATAQPYSYNFDAYGVAEADLVSTFGPQIGATIDARAEGYDFGDSTYAFPNESPLRNFNLISQVFQADQAVSITLSGASGDPISLQPGDFTYVYTLDYTGNMPGTQESTVDDFQILRTAFDALGDNPIAMDEILGGAYNTHSDFNAIGLTAYPDGFAGSKTVIPTFAEINQLEYNWTQPVVSGQKVMVMLFASVNTQPMALGQLSTGLSTNPQDGAEFVVSAGAATPKEVPLWAPVVPEPTSLILLGVATIALMRQRRVTG